MKTILAKVTVVRQPLEGKRKVDLEWKDSDNPHWVNTLVCDDTEGEFQIGDEVGISISKVR